MLLGFTFTANSLEELGFIISLFAIIVLTTFALHKLVMESRIKLLEQEVSTLQHEKFELESYINQVRKEYYWMVEHSLAKDLNSNHDFYIQKRDKNERQK